MAPPPPRSRRLRGAAALIAYAVGGVVLLLFGWLRKRSTPDGTPLFPRWSNPLLRGVLALGGLGIIAIPALLIWRAETPDFERSTAVAQPIPFSHTIHVTGLEIDCRYCHDTVERSAFAGMPSTRKCVPCHNPVWLESEAFEPVRESLATGRPIPWQRVHNLPDFTYFHHGIHSQKGVGCETCHGRVDQMATAEQVMPLTMEWCLECHREPERFLRPHSEITTMGWVADRPEAELGALLRNRYGVVEKTYCTTCHR